MARCVGRREGVLRDQRFQAFGEPGWNARGARAPRSLLTNRVGRGAVDTRRTTPAEREFAGNASGRTRQQIRDESAGEAVSCKKRLATSDFHDLQAQMRYPISPARGNAKDRKTIAQLDRWTGAVAIPGKVDPASEFARHGHGSRRWLRAADSEYHRVNHADKGRGDDSFELQNCGVELVSNTEGRPGLDGVIKHWRCDSGERQARSTADSGTESALKLELALLVSALKCCLDRCGMAS
jgi:hypothetical protein